MATPHNKKMYCICCGEWFNEKEMQKGHIIPVKRGGCDCAPNRYYQCSKCNVSEHGQRTFTPIEWWAEQQWKDQWKDDKGKYSVSSFDADAWTLEERQDFLQELTYYEARARWHIMTEHKDRELPNWAIKKET